MLHIHVLCILLYATVQLGREEDSHKPPIEIIDLQFQRTWLERCDEFLSNISATTIEEHYQVILRQW